MKAVFFDLGDTLEAGGSLVPKARETLTAIQGLRDKDGLPPQIGLISDFLPAPPTPAGLPALQQQYYAILDGLGIRSFFEPVSVHTTLSTEVGVKKPNKKIFRAALDKLTASPPLTFADAAFITETAAHVAAARKLHMKAICVKGGAAPTTFDVASLPEIVPLLKAWLLS